MLSVPKLSVSSTTDLRYLLTSMDPEVEAKLLGSLAEFNQLSTTEPFTIDEVNENETRNKHLTATKHYLTLKAAKK